MPHTDEQNKYKERQARRTSFQLMVRRRLIGLVSIAIIIGTLIYLIVR